MRQLADDLWLLDGLPPYAINVYLVGDVLIDAPELVCFGHGRPLRDPRKLREFAAKL